jgi:hypothetical protein
VKLAADHDAKQLRYLGRHLFEVIAPELADQIEGKALETEEARALQRTTLTMWEDDEGTTHGRFRIPALHGQMLEKMLLAFTAPSRSVATTTTGIDPDLPAPLRRGIAFTQILETLDAKDLPTTGGRISASEARRLACSAGIIPMVLGGQGQVLDVGRKRRLLCPHHHRRLHDPGYLTTQLPDGKLRFHRRE